MVTDTAAMYLLTIYRLTELAPSAKTGQIAAALSVHLPSVSEMLNKLEESGYIVRHGRTGVRLSSAGRQLALTRLRRESLLATFLVVMAGYEIDEVHEEASRLAHALSDRLADSLDKLLGYPTVDPFGHPIPSANGTVEIVSLTRLSDVEAGQAVTVHTIDSIDAQVMHYFRLWGLVPGAQVKVVEVCPLRGPITLSVAGCERPISYELAQMIGIEHDGSTFDMR